MQPPQDKRNFFKWLHAVANLSASREEKSLLWPLAFHANENGESYPGETTLCRESGIGNERTLRRWLRHLESRGWILTDRNTRPVKIGVRTLYLNAYRLTIPTRREDKAMSAHDDKTGGQPVQDGRTRDAGREDTACSTGGQSYVRQTTRGTTRGMTRGRMRELSSNDQRAKREAGEYPPNAKPTIL